MIRRGEVGVWYVINKQNSKSPIDNPLYVQINTHNRRNELGVFVQNHHRHHRNTTTRSNVCCSPSLGQMEFLAKNAIELGKCGGKPRWTKHTMWTKVDIHTAQWIAREISTLPKIVLLIFSLSFRTRLILCCWYVVVFFFFFASFVVWCLSCSYFLSTTISFCWFNPVDGVIVIIVVGVAVPLNCTMTVTRYTDTHTHTVMMTNDFSLIHWGFFFSLENHCCFLLLLFCYCCNSSYIFLVYVVYFHGQKMDKWVAIHVYDECLCIRANI